MGVNLWGASPLYVNPNTVEIRGNQVLAEGKGVSARWATMETIESWGLVMVESAKIQLELFK